MKTLCLISLTLIMVACGGNVHNSNDRQLQEGVQSDNSQGATDTNVLGGPLEDATTGDVSTDASDISTDITSDITSDITTDVTSDISTDVTGDLTPVDNTSLETGFATLLDDNAASLNDPSSDTGFNFSDFTTDGSNNISIPLLALLGLVQSGTLPNLNNTGFNNTGTIPNLDNLIGNILTGGNGSFPGSTTQNNLFCSALCSVNSGVSAGGPLTAIMSRIRQPICGC